MDHNTTVNAGTLTNLLQTFLKALERSLEQYGMNLKKHKDFPDGSRTFTISVMVPQEEGEDQEKEFMVNVKPDEKDKSIVDITFNVDGQVFSDGKYHGVANTNQAIENKILQFASDQFGIDALEQKPESFAVESSRKLVATLTKIESTVGSEIHLTAIRANYNAVDAMADVQALIADDSIADTASAEGTCYEVVPGETELDVTEVPSEVAPIRSSIISIMAPMYQLQMDQLALTYNACGVHAELLRKVADNGSWNLRWQLDELSKICVEKECIAPTPVAIIKTLRDVDPYRKYTFEEGFKIIKADMENIITSIELMYCNFDHDVQAVLDNWLRDYKRTLNYDFIQYDAICETSPVGDTALAAGEPVPAPAAT